VRHAATPASSIPCLLLPPTSLTPPTRRASHPKETLPCLPQVSMGRMLGQGCFGTTYEARWRGARVSPHSCAARFLPLPCWGLCGAGWQEWGPVRRWVARVGACAALGGKGAQLLACVLSPWAQQAGWLHADAPCRRPWRNGKRPSSCLECASWAQQAMAGSMQTLHAVSPGGRALVPGEREVIWPSTCVQAQSFHSAHRPLQTTNSSACGATHTSPHHALPADGGEVLTLILTLTLTLPPTLTCERHAHPTPPCTACRWR